MRRGWLRFGPWASLCLLVAGCGSEGSSNGGDDTTGGGEAATGGAEAADAGDVEPGTPTALTGALGDLGPVRPIVSTLVMSNSGERLVYMSTAPITCEMLTMSRWLGSVAADAQVVEVIFEDAMTTGTVTVADGAEVNYAPGGKSSAYEKGAHAGRVTITANTPGGVVEGTFEATYTNPTANVSGHFHAEFCEGGQGC